MQTNFKFFAELTQKQMKSFLKVYLKKLYKDIIVTEDYIIAKGDIPIGLVAHMDTVFNCPPVEQEIYYDSEKKVMWSPWGLGADDRAGITIIVELLQKTELRPTLIFTADEEKGCLGAFKLIRDYGNNFLNLNCLIELDRQGEKDCVFYDCGNKEFQQEIEKFGFKTAQGTFSDISVIAESWNVAAVNLSVGYYEEHSYSEYLCFDQMQSTFDKLINMISNDSILTKKQFDFQKIERTIKIATGFDYEYEICKCEKCGLETSDTVPIRNAKGESVNYCFHCFSTADVKWCTECGYCYIEVEECPVCKNKKEGKILNETN